METHLPTLEVHRRQFGLDAEDLRPDAGPEPGVGLLAV
jgi:hypothetical protein